MATFLPITRRKLLALSAGAVAAPLLPALLSAQAKEHAVARPEAAVPPSTKLAPADATLLDEMIRRGCDFFWERADPNTGHVLDRALADGAKESRRMASIASTGFGLSALCIADHYGYFPHAEIVERVRRTLRFYWTKLPQHEGFFWHFSDMTTGETARGSELSSMDTALLLCGVLTCRSYFADAEIKDLATKIYERVNWPWMLAGGETLSMGWFEKKSFIKARWDMFAEEMLLYLLAIGSPTHPLPPSAWDSFRRERMSYKGIDYISAPAPLFIHQFTQAWFDLRGKRDKYANYFENSKRATEAHRLFCISLGGNYSPELWGITSSDSIGGYTGWGGPPAEGPIDGTVVPSGPAGSLPFLPAECLQTLSAMRRRFEDKVWKRYGFVDAFNPSKAWYAPDVIGIDLGISVLMAENLRSGFVSRTFMKDPQMAGVLPRVGFHKD